MNLDKYDVSMATHLLKCRHQICRNGYNYYMKCIPLGRTKSRMMRVVVFGDRAHKNTEHRKRIRYVPPWKLKELTKTTEEVDNSDS